MRTMLLSLRPDVFQNVVSGKKIYEHRKVFPDEPIKAYIYVSRPIQAVTGIMILDNKTSLDSWKEKYKYDVNAIRRIEEYQIKNKFAMEIQYFQKTSQLSLCEIKKSFSHFVIPQMYYFLDGTELLKFFEDKLILIEEPIHHTFENVTSEMICRY